MADMFDSGRHTFKAWSSSNPETAKFYARWLGPFRGDMTGEEANNLLEGWKLTEEAQRGFIRGWEAEQAIWGEKNDAEDTEVR